nr:ATP-binding cassette domain-containing protein [Micromonospora sp. DSM 115978]
MNRQTTVADDPTAAAVGTALRMTGVTKVYGAARALDAVDLEVRFGEIHALMGENGAGKSTLIEILAGVVGADEGSIELAGAPVTIRSVEDARRLGVAVVHQELSFISNLTVSQNLFLGAEFTRGPVLDGRRAGREAEALLRRLGLRVDPDARGDQLDVAERQAVEICKALAQRAKILVLDEPTAALTGGERERLVGILESLRREGLAIIYVSHHLSEISRLADRVTVLRNGRRVVTEEMANLTEDAIVHAMIGESVGELFPPKGAAGDGVEPVLDVRGVSFGRRLRGVDLTVRPGEIVGVTGLVGSGHREVSRLAGGVLRPTGGTLTRRGGMVRFAPGDRKTEGLALRRSSRENLTMHVLDQLSLGRIGPRFIRPGRERVFAEELAAGVNLRGDVHGAVGSLSGGNQQKVLIGRSIANRADLLVLEEPTRGVDVGARADLYQLIRNQAAEGTGVLVVSTDLREVAGLCDRVVVLDRGRVVAELTGGDIDEATVYRMAHGSAQGAADEHAGGRDRTPWWRRLFGDQATVPLLALLALFVVAGFGSEVFLTGANVQNVASQSVVIGLVGLGQLLVVLTGGLDLTVGAVVGLTNLVATDLLMRYPLWLVVPIVLLIGAAIGTINGLLVRLGMPALLATFAMMSVIRGVVVWMYPKSIGPVPEYFWAFGRDTVLGVPTAFLMLVAILAAVGWMLGRSRFGLHLYAVGGDPRAAGLSGISANRMTLAAFVLSGLLAAVAGLYLTARAGAGLPNSGSGLELSSIAVVMIGGASLAGGRGTVRGVVAGVGIVTVLANMMNLWRLDAFLQDLIVGLVIVAVAVAWALRERRVVRRRQLGAD